jgi:DNA-binding transcriptional LysR family regulator
MKHLRLLVAIDELGSLHKAAAFVGMTQPGATKALGEIESTFDAALFTRHPQGLSPNDLGRSAVRFARLIHSDLAQLREEMLGIQQGYGGRLAVGSIMGAVPTLIRALTGLRQKQPAITISIVEDTSTRLLDLIDQGRLDLAICRTSVSRRPDAYQTLGSYQEPLRLVAHPSHPLAAASALGLAQLEDYPWVIYPTNTPMRLLLEREFTLAGLEFPRHPMETSSTLTTLMLLQEDPRLLALIPQSVADTAQRFGMIAQLALALQSQAEPFELVSRRGNALTAPAQLLLDALRQASGMPEPVT